jgi:predicted nucleic acid-binding protein
MRVFSNTTPFIALASIDQLQLLPQLFGSVHVAQSVIDECAEGGRILVPHLQDLNWVIALPDEITPELPVLFELDRGEKQTLLLALKHPGSRVIIDERLGRNVAEYMGLQVTGTLSLLAKAKTTGLIPSFYRAAQDMRSQGIRYSEGLVQRIAQHLGEPAP